MTQYSKLIQKIDSFKATVTPDSITPLLLGTILEEMLYFVRDIFSAIRIPTDWRGTQAEYNSLMGYDNDRWYLIDDDNEIVAVYRGASLVWAIPNCIGRFADDSTPDDWYWWPHGVKTALPVDPATCRFSFYYPEPITEMLCFYDPNAPVDSLLVSLERIPASGNQISLDYMPECKVMPTLDCRGIVSLNYLLIGRSWAPTRLHFKNTDNVTSLEMMLNIQKGQLKILTGFDCASLSKTVNMPFSINGAAYMPLVNLGMAPDAEMFDLRNRNWGDDTLMPGARQTLVDSLLTNSYNRAAAGYGAATIRLSECTAARLTDEEKAAIAAKGYTITAE